ATPSLGTLRAGSIGTITNPSLLAALPLYSGDSISITTMNGTVDATHLVNYSVNTMGGTTSVGTLSTGSIGTMTNGSTLAVSSPNTGDSVAIGTLDNGALVQAVHLVNYSVTTLSGITNVTGTIEGVTIQVVTSTGQLNVAGQLTNATVDGSTFSLSNSPTTASMTVDGGGVINASAFVNLSLVGQSTSANPVASLEAKTAIGATATANTWDITGPNSGDINGTSNVSFTGMQNLVGGDQNDSYVLF